jgi:hypothetical protein
LNALNKISAANGIKNRATNAARVNESSEPSVEIEIERKVTKKGSLSSRESKFRHFSKTSRKSKMN